MTRKLLYLNGIAILTVILFHSGGWGLMAMFSWAHRYGASPGAAMFTNQIGYVGLRIIEQIAVFSIPSFLFVSGFFIAFTLPANEKTIRWHTVFMRLKYLLIPYLLWSFINVAMLVVEGKFPGVWKTTKLILTGSITPAYYFVILLIQMYLLAPWLIRLAKSKPVVLILGTAFLQILFHSVKYINILSPESAAGQMLITFLPKWLFVTRLFWFSLGIIFCIYRKQFSVLFEGKTKIWLGFTIILWLVGFFEWEWLTRLSGLRFIEHRETLVDALYAFTFIMTMLSLDKKKLIQQKKVEQIGALSFGIYLSHIPVMEVIGRGIYHVLPALLSYQLAFTLTIALTGLLIPLLMMAVVKRSPLKRFYVYIFG
jgi:peptidoglycan/LPS O-acetylase OafA/YrhL